MPRNGSGSFTLPANSFSNPTPNTNMSSTDCDACWTDIEVAMSASIANNGETPIVSDLTMSGFKHTNVANATARNNYASAGQVQDSRFTWAGTAGGSGNAITLTNVTPAISAYVAGQRFLFVAAANNTGATTVSVSGLVAVALQANGAALTADQVVAGRIYEIIYTGTFFELGGAGGAGGAASQGEVDAGVVANKFVSPLTLDNWQGAAKLLRISSFTTSGTWNKIADTRYVVAYVLAGGGAGGNAISGGGIVGAAGGGGGGMAIKLIQASTLALTETVTIGSGASSGSGASGGTSSFGAHCSATGGSGSPGNDAGVGGVGVGGDINIVGAAGGSSINPSANWGPSGHGGSGAGPFGGGGPAGSRTNLGNVAGNSAAANTGAGGAGATRTTSGTSNGGAGGSGIVLIFEYGA